MWKPRQKKESEGAKEEGRGEEEENAQERVREKWAVFSGRRSQT